MAVDTSHWLCTACGASNRVSATRCDNPNCYLPFRVCGIVPRTTGRGGKRNFSLPASEDDEGSDSSELTERPPQRRRVDEPELSATDAAVVRRRRPLKQQQQTPLIIEEVDSGTKEYRTVKAEASWPRLQQWANTTGRKVVRHADLKRMFDFTTKILLVRRAVKGVPIGCALVCEAPPNCLVCDSLRSHTNPSLPMVKTARMTTFGPIRDSHVRTAFSKATGDHPIDELVLICGERGVGSAVMAHLKGRQRILFASVVPGSEAAERFYAKHFIPLPFERSNGEKPYATWLGE